METKAPGRIKRIIGWAKAHRLASSLVSAVALGLAIFLFLWFAPHKLFIDQTVNEAAPKFAVIDPSQRPSSPQPTENPVVASGAFRSLEHETKGRAVLLRLPNGSAVLRLEAFGTSNGPDVRVYLSEIPASDDWRAYGKRFIDLGALKGNIGDQNYAIPAGTDLSRFKSAVIWCRRFTVGFGVAPLTA